MQQQKESNISNNWSMGPALTTPTPFLSPNHLLNTPLPYFPDDPSILSLYPSIFSPDNSNSTLLSTFPSSVSRSLTPSSRSNDDEDDSTYSPTGRRLLLARLTLQYREMEDRYILCLSHLHDAVKELESLRNENFRLRKVNTDLTKLLNPVRQAKLPQSSMPLVNDFRRLNIGHDDSSSIDLISTNVLRHEQSPKISLPKSISIRSNGYLKSTAGITTGVPSRSGRIRVSSPVIVGSQRVVVPTKGKEEEAVEFEVYGQGMFKTELCNKWEETGACPYGDHCQFAHGIGELRPIIRHPRYKTEICRMVLAGEACPYGHRCHFRHVLAPNERCSLDPSGRIA